MAHARSSTLATSALATEASTKPEPKVTTRKVNLWYGPKQALFDVDIDIATNYPESFVEGFMSPNSAMPAQIYEWSKRADPAYYERAWGGIILLLVFLMVMNIIAVLLRRRFERRW